jgi:hypothetical protein
MANPGRVPELDEARSERVQVRLSEHERAAFGRASSLAGLSVGEWLRVAGLTAAGAGDLLAQLRRIEPSLVERLDTERRRRVMESRNGVLTPIWTHGPRANCAPDELRSENLRYDAAIVMHVLPAVFPYEPDEVWPPAKGQPRIRAADLNLPGYLPKEFVEEIDARRAAIVKGLLPPRLGATVRKEWAFEDGCILPAAVATNAMSDREPTKPHAYAVMRHTGRIETALELRRGDARELPLTPFGDLASILASQLSVLVNLGAPGPFALSLSLFGVKGRRLLGTGFDESDRLVLGAPLGSDEFFLPIVEVTGPEVDTRRALTRPLDALWQAGGHPEAHPIVRASEASK